MSKYSPNHYFFCYQIIIYFIISQPLNLVKIIVKLHENSQMKSVDPEVPIKKYLSS